MRIRDAVPADSDRIVAMATAFLAESAYGRLFPADPDRLGLLLQMCLELGAIFVAETEDGVIGMLAVVALTDPIGGVRYADEIAWWVEPACRTGFAGPRLLMAAQNWALARQCAFLKMVAPIDKPAVGEFYARVGYVPIETAYIKRFT